MTKENEKKPKKQEPSEPLIPVCGSCNQLVTSCKCKNNELRK